MKELNDDRWYREQLAPHEPLIRNWIRSRYPDALDLDDLIQDALLRVIKARKKSEMKSPKAFFFATARNLAIDTLRKKKVLFTTAAVDIHELELMDDAEPVEETVARNHELEVLTRAIQTLPKRCRRVFTLSKVYGMSYQEISEEMGISFHTVSSQIAIGLKKCMDYMQKHGMESERRHGK